MKKLYNTDYVVIHITAAEPLDVCYSAETVIELFNNGFALSKGEAFVKMTDLPSSLQQQYLNQINTHE